jgi:hypothetical protein
MIRGIVRACALPPALAVVLCALVPATAVAAEPGPAILTPAEGSSGLGAPPTFTGTSDGAEPVRLSIYKGSGETELVEEISAPVSGTETWEATLSPVLPAGLYTAVARELGPSSEELPPARVHFTIEAIPEVTAEPEARTVTAGEPASFSAAASGVPSPSVQWEVSTDGGKTWAADTTDPGNTSTTLAIAAAEASQDGNEYRAVFKNTAGEAKTAAVTLTVDTVPSITAQPEDEIVTAGEPASFSAAASGVPSPGVQWEVSADGGKTWAADTTDPGNTSTTLTITAAEASQNGNEYRAVFKNTAGEATSAAATLTVDTLPAITEEPKGLSRIVGESAVFAVEVSGSPAPAVQWEVSSNKGSTWAADTKDAGVTTPTLTVASVSLADNGLEYRAHVTNRAGGTFSSAALLSVSPPPVAPSITSQPHSTRVIAGEQASFSAAASGVPTPGVQWEVSTDGGEHWAADTSDAGNTSTTLKIAAAEAAQNGNEYRAVFKNASGEATTSEVTLTVDTVPTITAQPASLSELVGESAVFTVEVSGSPAPSVQWEVSSNKGGTWTADTKDAGNKTATLVVVSVSLPDNGLEYRAHVTNRAGGTFSNAAALSVSPAPAAPSITAQPHSTSVIAGEQASFSAAASGVPTPSVQWEISTDGGEHWAPDTADSGNTSTKLTIAAALAAQSGDEYRAVFNNASGEAKTAEVTLTVDTFPAITAEPKSLSRIVGEAAVFSVGVSGSPAPAVQWEVSSNGGSTWAADTNDAGATTPTLTVASVSLADNGLEYRAHVTNRVGGTLSTAALLSVSLPSVPPSVTAQPHSRRVIAGQPASFTAAASGTPSPTVKWEVSTDGGNTWAADTGDAGNTSTTLTIAAAGASQNGNEYRAVFTNSSGEATTAEATLTVDTVPVITAQPESASRLAAETAVFTIEASGSPEPAVQWEVSTDGGNTWSADTKDLGNKTVTLVVANVSLADNGLEYRAHVTNRAGGALSNAAVLGVSLAPIAPSVTRQPADTTVAEGHPATFKAAATGVPSPAVQWEVSADGGLTWAPDTSDAGNTSPTLEIVAAASTQKGYEYRAVFSNGAGHAETGAATLTVDTPPTFTLQPEDQEVAVAETAVFTVEVSGSPAPTLQWEVSADHGNTWTADTKDLGNTTPTLIVKGVLLTANGLQYRAHATNRAGEAFSNAVLLSVFEEDVAPSVTRQPSDTTVNEGQPARFTAAAKGVPSPGVQWEVSTDGGMVWAADTTDAGNTSTTLEIAAAAASQNGWEYRAAFRNGAGKAETGAATLTVNTAPVVTVPPLSATVTEGSPVTFTAAASGRPVPTVQWQISTDGGHTWAPDTGDVGATTNSLAIAAAAASQNGYQYRAVFLNAAGEAASAAALLTVSPRPAPQPPVASFKWFPATPAVGETVSLASTSTAPGAGIASFAWDLAGSGVLKPGSAVMSTTFATAGAHSVSLRVTATNGLSTTVTQTIHVAPRRIPLMQPFPIVRIAGSDSASGARLTLVSIQAPAGVTITVSCRGRGCPRHGEKRTVPGRSGKSTVVTLKRFQRRLLAGAVLQIRITHAGEIGKYTRLTILRRRVPTRSDACVGPSSPAPIACPTS